MRTNKSIVPETRARISRRLHFQALFRAVLREAFRRFIVIANYQKSRALICKKHMLSSSARHKRICTGNRHKNARIQCTDRKRSTYTTQFEIMKNSSLSYCPVYPTASFLVKPYPSLIFSFLTLIFLFSTSGPEIKYIL